MFNVQDIEGAQPKLRKVSANRPDFHDPTDICRDPNMRKPATESFKTKRIVNPLLPVYKLPSFKYAPSPKPKFIRNTHDVADIKKLPTKGYCLQKSSLFPAKPNSTKRPTLNKQKVEKTDFSLDVSDIMKRKWKTNRTTNPLSPKYSMNYMNFGSIQGTHPKNYSKKYIKSYHLSTHDVEGAQADTRKK